MAKDIISEIIYGRFVSNLLITHPSLLHEMVIECEFLTQRNQNFKWAFLSNNFSAFVSYVAHGPFYP